jgi:hypothetical protein
MKVNVNTTPTLTIIVETFLSDKKYFGQTKPISLSDRMTDRSSDNLAQTGKVRMLANNYFAFYPNNIGTNYYPNITNTNNTCISIFLTILLTLV